MKTLLLSIFTIALSLGLSGQGCDNLIISEYLEGWSNNKALEVYNASPNPIDMNGYGLVRFANGSQTPSNSVALEGTLMPYETYVVVLDKRDSTGTGFEAPVWDELQMQADSFVNPLYNDGMETMYFNGNDAIGLINADATVIYDFFGKLADLANPDGWGPYTDSQGETVYMSANHTLVRKASVTTGIMTNPGTFDLQAEWDTLPANTFDNLGFHLCNCNPNSIEEIRDNSIFNIFPNPANDGSFQVSSEETIEEIVVYSLLGEKVYDMTLDVAQSEIKVNTTNWVSGAYLVNLRTESNIVSTRRIIVK